MYSPEMCIRDSGQVELDAANPVNGAITRALGLDRIPMLRVHGIAQGLGSEVCAVSVIRGEMCIRDRMRTSRGRIGAKVEAG